MPAPQLRLHADPSDVACSTSAHCQPARAILDALALPLSSPWLWLHLGPIGPTLTPASLHGPAATPARIRTISGGGGQVRDRRDGGAPSWPEQKNHVGFHLDLFGLSKRPPVQAHYHATARLWVVRAVAYRDPAGPWAVWSSSLDAPCRIDYHFTTDTPVADDLDLLARCVDLIHQRRARPGRPSRWSDPAWRSYAEAAEAKRRASPSLSWKLIAQSLGLGLRTLGTYRAELRRERAAGQSVDPPGPMLVPGGPATP